MTIEFDPAKARSNLRKHGLSFAHAEQVFLWLLRSSVGASFDAPASRGQSGRWSGQDGIPTQSVGTR